MNATTPNWTEMARSVRGHPVLEHVLAGGCTDPDCEVHCIEVGLAEGTVTATELAFYIAGAERVQRPLTYAAAEEAHPGLIAYLREQFIGNECDSDEYRETQPAKGLGMAAHWAELDPSADMTLVVEWLQAVGLGGSYAGASELALVLGAYFDALMAQGEDPYYGADVAAAVDIYELEAEGR